MKISEMIHPETIVYPLKANTKHDVILELANAMTRTGKLHSLSGYIEAIEAREDLGSTGVGFGIAIPHAKTSSVKEPGLAFGISPEGIDYQSLDGEKAHLFFMIAAPEGENNLHLQTLAKLSRKLMNDEFREAFYQLKDKAMIIEHLKKIDEEVSS